MLPSCSAVRTWYYIKPSKPRVKHGITRSIIGLAQTPPDAKKSAINPTVYSPEDFQRRIRRENHFLKTVLREEPLFVIGTQDDLAKLAASPKGKATPLRDLPPCA
jgi:hypothetical protein